MTSCQLSSGDLTADRRAYYARLYAESREFAAAADLQAQALELVPGWAAGWHELGCYHEKSGDLAAAAVAWRKVLSLTQTDIFGAELKLSLTGQAEIPATPPAAYVEALFDDYSDRFDTALIEDLGYSVPDRLTTLLIQVAGEQTQFAKAIDLGCGTGLFGERIRRMTSWLEGYDLSQGMLAKAREKGVYDGLGQADIQHGFSGAPPGDGQAADLVAAADVFAYFGDLDGVLATAANLAAPGGLIAFSCEAGDDDADWRLRASLRYCHSEAYLRRCLDQSGLAIERLVREPIRRDGAEVISGYLVIARKWPQAGASLKPAREIASEEAPSPSFAPTLN